MKTMTILAIILLAGCADNNTSSEATGPSDENSGAAVQDNPAGDQASTSGESAGTDNAPATGAPDTSPGADTPAPDGPPNSAGDSGGNCGNGKIDQGEQCDALDLGGRSCGAFNLGGGQLACKADCTLDASNCNVDGSPGEDQKQPCGDGVLSAGEQCDGSDFSILSCASFGYAGGTLTCSADCRIGLGHCTRSV